jgi:hypothetical protein
MQMHALRCTLEVVRSRRSVFPVLAAGSLAACGNFIGWSEPAAEPPTRDAAAAESDGGDSYAAEDGGGTDVGVIADASGCRADGTLEVDMSFGVETIPLAVAKTTHAASGEIVTFGRTACDGGSGLSMHRVLLDGSIASAPPCFGSGSTENVASVWSTANGFVLASDRLAGNFRARVTRIDTNGAHLGFAEMAPASGYSSTYARFAVEAAGRIVWAGYHYSQVGNPELGFLAVMGGAAFAVPAGELPVTAAVSGSTLYVLFAYEPTNGGTKQVVLRRFAVGNTLTEDPAFSSAGVSRLDLATNPAQFEGIGSMIVEDEQVTIAAPNGSAISLLRFDGAAWTAEAVPALARGHLVRACDGSLILAASNPSAVRRLTSDGGATMLPLANPQLITSLVQDEAGQLYVTQVSGAQHTLVRIDP